MLAVLAALPVAPSDLDRHQFPKETLVHLGVWLALLVSRPWSFLPGRGALRVGAVALGGWSIVTAFFATNPWMGWRAAALTVTGLAAFALVHHLARAGETRTLLGWAALAAAVGAGTGLAQAMGYEHPSFSRLRAPGGTFGNRNFLAHIAAAALPVVAFGVVTTRRRVAVIVGAIGFALLASALVLTRSRAGWLAAIAGLGTVVVLVAFTRFRRSVPLPIGRAVLLTAMLGAGAAAAIVVPNTLEWRSDSPYTDTLGNLTNYREGSGRGRLLQYQNTLMLAVRHPLLGVGAGNWSLHYGEVAPRGDPSFASNDVVPLNPWPSSDWLALASERGVPGVLAALLLAFGLAWRGVVALRIGGERALAGATLLGTLAAIGVAGLFDAVLLLAVPVLFTAIVVGALAAAADGDAEASAPVGSPGSWLLLVLVTSGLVRSTMQTAGYLVAGDGTSRTRLERAALIDPFNYQLRIRLARGPCRTSRDDARAALQLAPTWPAAKAAARRCGVRLAAQVRPYSDQLPS